MRCVVDDLMIEYIREGTGPLVIVLHGWGTSGENMWPVIKALQGHYTVLVPDLPGFGGSERPHATWGVGDYAAFTARFIEKVAPDTAIAAVIGHSFGGRIAIKGCGTGALKPSKVILIGSAGVKHSASLRNQLYKSAAKAGKAALSLPGLSRFSDIARRRLYIAAGASDYLDAGPMQAIFSKTIDEDLQADATKITQPVLLIWGSRDNQAPLADAKVFERIMPHASLKVIDGAGHFVHTEHPDTVTKWCEEFLGS